MLVHSEPKELAAMTKSERICTLFARYFEADDLLTQGIARGFHCPNEADCLVDQYREPIWTPAIGEENTHVIIVAEAPSKTGGLGPHIGGCLTSDSDTMKMSKSPLRILISFVQENYGITPYFTDLVKCGADSKALIKSRASNCFKRFLLKELKIMDPEIVLCVGNLAQSFLVECQSRGTISRRMRLISLIHYSRQAGLPLSPEDKKNIIWKWQIGSHADKEKIAQLLLSNLYYFQGKAKSEGGC